MNFLYNWVFKSKNTEEIKLKTYIVYSVIGFISALIFSILGFLNDNYALMFFDLLLAVNILFFGVFAYRNRSMELYKTWGLIPLFMFGAFNFTNGGLVGAAIYWTFMIPVLTFFLSTIRIALTINIVYIITVAFIHYFQSTTIGYESLYSDSIVITYILSYIGTVLVSLLFKEAWDFSNKFQKSERDVISNEKSQLAKKVDELKKTKLQLEQSNEELGEAKKHTDKINDILLERETTMIRLKNKINKLESQIDKYRDKSKE